MSFSSFRVILTNIFSPAGRYPLLANTLSSGCLFVLGDLIQQTIEIKSKALKVKDQGQNQNGQNNHLMKSIDTGRTGRIAIIGFTEGPPHHYFYLYLDKLFPGRTFKIVVQKIILDQLIAAPVFASQFFIGMAWLEGKGLKDCWREFTSKFPAVYLFDWIFWPPIQAINFYFVPQKFRVLYVNSATIIWDIFLSYMKHYDQKKSIPNITNSTTSRSDNKLEKT